ncbi:hypothetical protein PI87_08800 [Ralstonia sp. A12]|uniref:DUF262 domain-containing protein n=1 Tax=Ralstonia sp. A12 TaxID=1217052 RepID=UPI000575297C|nr:DUF262 domain-containing protein [Ralstonia sp. A12]KHK57308.1 hypothetical protein PI87_08800 [Ralstonia sp. A12]
MSTRTIEQFFTGKSLEIPPYQRDYAWSTTNVDDLFDDILEAMEMGGSHYLGTFILSAGATKDRFKVVDGQQRLTTLTMLLDAMVAALPEGEVKTYYRSTFLRHPVHGPKFTVLGENQAYFAGMLEDKKPHPATEGQVRLKEAYGWIRQRVKVIKGDGGERAIQKWLENIGKLEVLEFIEAEEGKAIRMFQSVNDRGVPLSKMDIAKSLLIYYSNRFLSGELDEFVAERFGSAFRDYSLIKGLAAQEGYQIRLINRNAFREDDVFRYHYFAFNVDEHASSVAFDYNASSETVLEFFLKPILKALRSDAAKLSAFIRHYVADLADFFAALRALIQKTRDDKELYMLFVVGDLAATLYPLTTRLAMRGVLRERAYVHVDLSLLQMIEVADLRVFKLRGTNPQADILNLTRESADLPLAKIASHLRWFVSKFMDDGMFESRLSTEEMYRNPGLLRILSAAEEDQRVAIGTEEFEVQELVSLVCSGQTVEHVLPQEPSFGVRAHGFATAEAYLGHIHRLGNLTLLESTLNSSCNNQAVEIKMKDKKLYRASGYEMTKSLAAMGATKTPAFARVDIDKRSAELARLCVARWPLWDYEEAN